MIDQVFSWDSFDSFWDSYEFHEKLGPAEKV